MGRHHNWQCFPASLSSVALTLASCDGALRGISLFLMRIDGVFKLATIRRPEEPSPTFSFSSLIFFTGAYFAAVGLKKIQREYRDISDRDKQHSREENGRNQKKKKNNNNK
ncbi:hypothetical protein [Roseibium aggregatum]|uniref:hypothetical protein n=1 Tax=Roseibium aggregatum TaxID=187304 RepID=UPI0012F4EF2E|nr:hypothetical protein [Roseibium aggregatum]